MNRQELINDVSKRVPYLRKQDVKLVIMETLNLFEEALKKGERITLAGFGSWSTRLSPSRRARNPKTGEMLEVPPRLHVRWTSAAKLRESLKTNLQEEN